MSSPDENPLFKNEGCSDGISPPKRLRLSTMSLGEFAVIQKTPWIIKDILPRSDIAMVYGESGSGKSFLVLDLALAIARGEAWNDKITESGTVVYVAAEGTNGLRNRLVAYSKHYQVDLQTIPSMRIIPDAPNLLIKKDVDDLIKYIGKADLIVFDTLARCMPGGDENSSEAMGLLLKNCQLIKEATEAVIILIHHAGKDTARGARGWSGLKAAVDTEIEVIRVNGNRSFKITKQKDGDEGHETPFELTIVPIGEDEDGDEITSCVFKINSDGPLPKQFTKKLAPWPQSVWDEFIGESKYYVLEEELIQKVVENSPGPPPGQRDTRQQQARRALKSLCVRKLLHIKDGKVYKLQ